jgi:hypothetical protein
MLAAPSHAEVLDVARRTAERLHALLRKSGRSLERQADEPEPALLLAEPGLASCYAAAAQGISISGERAGLPQLRLVLGTATSSVSTAESEPRVDEPAAEHRGVNLHAKQCVDGRDRKRLERLCRYITRPPVAQDRLERLTDGRVELRLKHPWRDGTSALLLEPDDLIGAAGGHRAASSLSPAAPLRRALEPLEVGKEVVPTAPVDPTAHAPPPASGDPLELTFKETNDEVPPRRKRWAWLLRHVLQADLDTCPRCSGPMRWLEAASTPEQARHLLARLGVAPRPPPRRPAPPLGQLTLPFHR